MGSSDKSRYPFAEEIDVGHTILARDWKGLNNYGCNGVAEPEGFDFSVNNPQPREIANCIAARTDRGISNRKAEGTCIIEQTDEN